MVRRAFVPGTDEQDEDKPAGPGAAASPRVPEPGRRPASNPESDIESLLGPDVRTPGGIPRDYRPLESSRHDIFRIDLGTFAGPLDLLLYLIKKHDLDIFDIPIKFITDRYLAAMDQMDALPIDIAAEFLVLASELMHIKSKMLLPAEQGVAVAPDELEQDPREELVRRLLEYQKYRDAANQLSDRDQLGRDVFARVAPTNELSEVDPGLKNVSVFTLVEVMASLMKRERVHHAVTLETVSVGARIEYVLAFGEARDNRFTLVQLLQGIGSKGELIITFIAVLEMTRLGLLKVYAEDPAPRGPRVGAVEKDGLEQALASPESASAEGEQAVSTDPELPTIWVHLTGKKLSGEIRDDYR